MAQHREASPATRRASQHTVGISGQSLLLNANAPNLGSMYVMLQAVRRAAQPRTRGRRHRRRALRERCRQEVRGAVVTVVRRAADRRPGHDRRLQADHRGPRQSRPGRRCSGVSDQIVARGNNTPGLQGLFNSSRANTPWLYLDIDRTKCMALGVPVSDVFNTLAGLPGLLLRQQLQRVRPDLAGERPGRPALPRPRRTTSASSRCRNNQGQMVRLGTLLRRARHQRPGAW